jgi:uncharacterized protein YhdP
MSFGPFAIISVAVMVIFVSFLGVTFICQWIVGLIVMFIAMDSGGQASNTSIQTIVQGLSNIAPSRHLHVFLRRFGRVDIIDARVRAANDSAFLWSAGSARQLSSQTGARSDLRFKISRPRDEALEWEVPEIGAE